MSVELCHLGFFPLLCSRDCSWTCSQWVGFFISFFVLYFSFSFCSVNNSGLVLFFNKIFFFQIRSFHKAFDNYIRSLNCKQKKIRVPSTHINLIFSFCVLFRYLSDKYGRKKTLLGSVIMSLILAVGQAFSSNYPLFLVLRTFSGSAYCIVII